MRLTRRLVERDGTARATATVRTAGALASGGMSLHVSSTRPAPACRLPCHAETGREPGVRPNRDRIASALQWPRSPWTQGQQATAKMKALAGCRPPQNPPLARGTRGRRPFLSLAARQRRDNCARKSNGIARNAPSFGEPVLVRRREPGEANATPATLGSCLRRSRAVREGRPALTRAGNGQPLPHPHPHPHAGR